MWSCAHIVNGRIWTATLTFYSDRTIGNTIFIGLSSCQNVRQVYCPSSSHFRTASAISFSLCAIAAWNPFSRCITETRSFVQGTAAIPMGFFEACDRHFRQGCPRCGGRVGAGIHGCRCIVYIVGISKYCMGDALQTMRNPIYSLWITYGQGVVVAADHPSRRSAFFNQEVEAVGVDEDKSKTPGVAETDLFATCEPALVELGGGTATGAAEMALMVKETSPSGKGVGVERADHLLLRCGQHGRCLVMLLRMLISG
jgi:hypothetical protein